MRYKLERFQKNGIVYYAAPVFGKFGAAHMFTTRIGGVSRGIYESLNFRKNCDDSIDNVMENSRRAARALNRAPETIVCTKQVHGNKVTKVEASDAGIGFSRTPEWQTDALITDLNEVTLAGFFADCLLMHFLDTASRAIGVAHAGWRGTSFDIALQTVEKMKKEYGSRPEDILVALSPCICKNCFETDYDVPEAMLKNFGSAAQPYIRKSGDKWLVDIAGINISRLLSCGIKPDNVINGELCTKCSCDEFWSHRATNGMRGVQAGLIALA